MFYLGIDVAKAKLDCVLLDPQTQKRKSKTVENSHAGLTALIAAMTNWGFDLSQIHAVIEPTASYHELAALALHNAGCTVSLVNPFNVRRYAEAMSQRSKTDMADAAVLARYGAAEKPAPWEVPSPSAQALTALLARRNAVAQDLQREKNRTEKLSTTNAPDAVRQSLKDGVAFLEQQLERLQKEIDQHIDGDPGLRDKRAFADDTGRG